MASNLRSETAISLFGFETNQMLGAKLPTNRQVLKVFFHILHQVKLSKTESAKLVIKEVSIFWEKARIQTREPHHCVAKVVKLYEEWREIQKHAERINEIEKKKRENFIENLDMLFDIARASALDKLRSDEDKQFLLNQRSKTLEGCLVGVDENQTKKEKR